MISKRKTLPSIKQIEVLIMTSEEYNKKQFSIPYIYEISNASQVLVYFGANHSEDPENYQYPILEKEWNQFKERVDIKKTLILVEGGQREIASNKVEAIRQGTEGDFIAYVAAQEGIGNKCPEPSRVLLNNEIAQEYPRRYVIFAWFVRYLDAWHRQSNQHGDFKKYIYKNLILDKNELGWHDVDFSIGGMIAVFKELFPNREFDELDGELYYLLSNPHKNINVINEINRRISLIRNAFIVRETIKYWNEGYSLFIPFGSGHAVVQEPALRKLLV